MNFTDEEIKEFKTGFIINNFADNTNFDSKYKIVRKPEPHLPKINVWTSQPVETIKTMKHL